MGEFNGKKRSELPDSVFGIPQERKYPMPDEKHTRSAIKLFNHVESKYEEQLAKAVIKNMKKYGIDGSVVGPNNRLRKYLPKDMLKESAIEEGHFKSDKDIYYNKDKFDSGEINLCFITGHSGSGKSTMARSMQSDKVEYYELDDLNQNYKFTDNTLKEYGDLIYSFFKGPGKKYRYHSYDDMQNCTNPLDDSGDEFDKFVNRDFVKYAMKYAKSHKNTKFVIEGIWLYFFFKPEELKDYAVYIKGTSRVLSAFRAAKRDSKDADTKTKRFIYSIKGTLSTLINKYSIEGEKLINNYRKYYENLQKVNEFYIEESSNNKVYHLSQTNLDGKTIQPTVPSNYMTKNGYEDGKTKRVCFATSIDGCLRGLSLKCEGMKLFVHALDGNYNIYKPSNKEVPDASITGEVWIKKAVKMKCIGQIYVIGDKGEDGIPYKYGDKTAELYDWEWKWIDKFNESYIEESSRYKYSPPYTSEEIKRVYGNKVYKRLSKDPAHKYRMDTGIELIHKEPTKEELERIWKNWNLMSDYQKRESDKKSIELFGMTNQDHYNELIDSYDINESASSTVSKDHKQKGYISLSSLKKVHITESIINKYKKEYPVLRHVRCKDTNEYICDGYMWFKENDLVCYVGSCQYIDDHTKWIVSLEIIPKYRGYGLSNQILDYCVKSMKCKYLSVNKNNELAKKIYDKYGFRVYHEDNTMYYMTIDKSIKESPILPQNTGISTVIFDIGDVLISDNFKELLMKDSEIPTELADTIKSLWFIAKDEIDDTMDLDTYREIVNKRMGPEFSKYIPKLFQYGIECVHVLDYTVPMIQDLKERGYKVYYLSNWSAWTHELLEKAGKFDFLKYMDGGIFSYDVGYMKPDEEIYRILLNRYKINPKEAIFFDDKKENIDAANKLGIHGVLFPRHNSSIIYNALSDMESKSLNEYGVTGGAMVGTNQPDSVYIVNYMQNNVFSGHKEQKQAICKKGMNQMYTTKNGKSVPVDKNKFKEEASDVSVFRFKGSPFLSYDKIVESAIQDSDYYSLLTGDDISSPEYMKYDNRFIEEEPYTEYLDDITSCIESSIVGTQFSEEYPYMKVLTESVDGRCWNYYNDINGYFIMNELTGLRSPSYDSIEEIPESQIKVIERGTIYLGE